MKWYWWLSIAVVITIVILLVVRSNKAKQSALNQIAVNTEQTNEFDPFSLDQITRK